MAHEQKEIVQFFTESLGYFKEISFEQDCLNYLHMAADLGRIDFVNILIENGLKINEQDRNGYSPLHFACFRGHKLMVDHLLRLGADPKLRNIYWRTPAEEARTRGNNDIASFIDNYVVKQ